MNFEVKTRRGGGGDELMSWPPFFHTLIMERIGG